MKVPRPCLFPPYPNKGFGLAMLTEKSTTGLATQQPNRLPARCLVQSLDPLQNQWQLPAPHAVRNAPHTSDHDDHVNTPKVRRLQQVQQTYPILDVVVAR